MKYFWLLLYLGAMGYVAWWIYSVVRARMYYEVYAALGIGLYFSEVFFGGLGPHLDTLPVKIAGLVLFVPAAILVIMGFITLHHVGRPKKGWEETTTVIESGVFRVTRHPVFFGATLWAVGSCLMYQSVVALVLATASIFCLYRASVGDEVATSRKLGAEYDIYCMKVPRWNIIAGLIRLISSR